MRDSFSLKCSGVRSVQKLKVFNAIRAERQSARMSEIKNKATTFLENLEMSDNFAVVREMSRN